MLDAVEDGIDVVALYGRGTGGGDIQVREELVGGLAGGRGKVEKGEELIY